MLQPYKLDRPNLSAINEAEFVQKIKGKNDLLLGAVHAVSEPAYLNWDKIRYNPKIPKDLTPEEFWYFVKQVRKHSSRKSVIKAESGEHYSWLRLIYTDEYLHKLDMQLGANK